MQMETWRWKKKKSAMKISCQCLFILKYKVRPVSYHYSVRRILYIDLHLALGFNIQQKNIENNNVLQKV